MSKPIAVVFCPGRGAYGREELSFIAKHHRPGPIADALASEWPSVLIRTSGEDVGLPVGSKGPVMGNSEVGHQNLGAGRIVDQEL